MAQNRELDAHHRATVEKIFNHPVSHNIQWHDVLSLLQSVGGHAVCTRVGIAPCAWLGTMSMSPCRCEKARLTRPGIQVPETFDSPRHHGIDEQQVVDLRRMLRGAGITPKSTAGLDVDGQ